MCRWISLMSSERVVLSDIILHPTNSLIDLAKDASYHPGASNMNNHVTNGDGFGVGWYHANTPVTERQGADEDFIHGEKEMENYQAAVFKDTLPAWNNSNLKEVSHAVRSHCIVAHVRAASRFAGISSQNCHPFKAGRLLFCHNGRIPHFNKIKRTVMDQMSNEAYVHIKGTTDSEAFFGLILTCLARDEVGKYGNPIKQRGPFGHKRLSNAITKTLGILERAIRDAGLEDNFSTLNFCLTDGRTMVVTRFCDKSPQVPPPSLYFAYGDAQTVARELIVPPEDDDVEIFPQLSPANNTGHRRINSNVDEPVSDPGSGSGETDDDEDFLEKKVDLDERQSRSGTRFSDVDVKEATFLVASCPLTPTHTWHPMPQNSIIWYSLGSRPELRLLKKKGNKRTVFHGQEPPIILEKVSLDLVQPMPVEPPTAHDLPSGNGFSFFSFNTGY